jgi:hypothetical protein
MGERPPEIVDEVGLALGANIVEHGLGVGREFMILEQLDGRHDDVPCG